MSRWATGSVALSVWIVLIVLAGAAGVAYAEHDTRPIAVPRAGGDGRAATYPSTLNVVAPGGPSQQSQVGIELHAVTHPCPEHLAVLLVHNDTDKYLRMPAAPGHHDTLHDAGRARRAA